MNRDRQARLRYVDRVRRDVDAIRKAMAKAPDTQSIDVDGIEVKYVLDKKFEMNLTKADEAKVRRYARKLAKMFDDYGAEYVSIFVSTERDGSAASARVSTHSRKRKMPNIEQRFDAL